MRLSQFISLDLRMSTGGVLDVDFETLAPAGEKIEKTFCTFVEDPKFAKVLPDNASVVLTNGDCRGYLRESNALIVDNPKLCFFRLHNLLAEQCCYRRKQENTRIGRNVKIGKFVDIASKNVVIGDNVEIENFAVIKENTIVGDNCLIRSGVVIGGEGFEFKKDEKGGLFRAVHLGGVVLGRSVEIQYNSTIDKALFPWDDTVVGDFTKIDNLVHIGHGVKIGERCLVAGKALIAGRTRLGSDVWVGPSAVLSNQLKVEDQAYISIGSVVVRNIGRRESVAGNFAINKRKFMKYIKKVEM